VFATNAPESRYKPIPPMNHLLTVASSTGLILVSAHQQACASEMWTVRANPNSAHRPSCGQHRCDRALCRLRTCWLKVGFVERRKIKTPNRLYEDSFDSRSCLLLYGG
jgi:hypothetical protein